MASCMTGRLATSTTQSSIPLPSALVRIGHTALALHFDIGRKLQVQYECYDTGLYVYFFPHLLYAYKYRILYWAVCSVKH